MRSFRPSLPSRRFAGAAALALLLGLLALVVAACSPGAATPSGGITVHDAWVRAVPGGDTAAYMTITNSANQPDRLTAVTSPGIGTLELMRTQTDASGMSGMNMIEGIDIPAGGSVTLAAGGLHIMVMDLPGPLNQGDQVELDLTFENAGTIKVMAEVRQG
jgi:copper(I)-binding protein